MIKFSIVIPLYNKENNIAATIESVLIQSYEDFEVIIVDDGSTDNSLAVLKRYNDPRIKLFSQENSGVSSARNCGIKESSFEFIAFLDADDRWKKDYLYEMSSLIKKFPKSLLYSSGYSLHYAEHIYEKSLIDEFDGEYGIVKNYYYNLILGVWGLHASSSIVRRRVFYQIGFFPVGVQHGEDTYVWDRIAAIGEVAHTSKILAIYSGDVDGQLTSLPSCSVAIPSVIGLNDLLNNYEINIEKKEWIRRYILKLVTTRLWYKKNDITLLREILKVNAVKQHSPLLVSTISYPLLFPFFRITLLYRYMIFHVKVSRLVPKWLFYIVT